MHLIPQRPTFLGELPPGEGGTKATLQLMSRIVRRYKRSPEVRESALSLISDLLQKDRRGEVNAVFTFVRDHIRYVRDIRGLETVQTPPVTLDLAAGDCDDKSTLLAAMLESIGFATRFVAVGHSSPNSYSHVYVEVLMGSTWVPLDATMPHPVGWAPRPPMARMVVNN